MSARAFRSDERAVSSVVGAILVLAIVGASLVYVNAYHVPEKGEALEVASRERTEAALRDLAAGLASSQEGAPLLADLPLRPPAPDPPLLAGLVLTPARAHGTLSFDPEGATLSVTHVTRAPSGGLAPGDPVREPLPGGLMRVHDVGSRAGGRALGSLDLAPGAAYLDAVSYSLEGGAVVAKRDGRSSLVSPPPLSVTRGGTASEPTTVVSWRIPLLAGAASEVSGSDLAQVSLTPGPASSAGGGQRVHEVSLVVTTDALAAWKGALEELVGRHGVVTVVPTGPDSGTVTATILPPAGTPAGTPRVELSLQAARYVVGMVERGAG